MQQQCEQHDIEKHEFGKQATWDCAVPLFKQIVKGKVAPASESYNKNQDG